MKKTRSLMPHLCVLLALIMVFFSIPFNSMATEQHGESKENYSTEISKDSEESIETVQERIDKIDLKSSYPTNEFHPIIEQFSYELNQTIPLVFRLKCDENVESLCSHAYGFEELQCPTYSKGQVTAEIVFKDATGQLEYSISATLTNGVVLETTVFGAVFDNRIYINGNSYFGARDIYYSELQTRNEYSPTLEPHVFLGEEISCIREESYTLDNTQMSQLQTRSEDTFITGTLQWKDDSGNWHPLQFTKVTVYDEDGGFLWSDVELGTVYTNKNGTFNLSFTNRSGGCNLYIKVYPAGETSVVKTGAGNEYVWTSNVTAHVDTGSTSVINAYIDMSQDIGRAFQVSQAVIIASKYAALKSGANIADVTVKYPHNESTKGCYYSGNTIYIYKSTTEDTYYSGIQLHPYACWDAIMHEYNHHVQTKLDLEDNPGRWHAINISMYEHYMSHHSGSLYGDCKNTCAHPDTDEAKEAAIKIAYAEAWASVVGCMGQEYAITFWNLDTNILTVGNKNYDSYTGWSFDYNTYIYSDYGEDVEAAVAGVLWDFYDNDVETNDGISLGHSVFWNASVNNNAKTLSEFVYSLYHCSSGTTYASKAGSTLSSYRIASTKPTMMNASSVSQNVPPQFNWISQGGHLTNNNFVVVIYDGTGSEILRTTEMTTSTYTLTQDQWNSVLYSDGQSYYVAIASKQTNSPITGEYISERAAFSKPSATNLTQTINISSGNRYTEKNVALQPGQYIDYTVTFGTAGSKMIQTMGVKDTIIELYDENDVLLKTNDDGGIDHNAFVRANLQNNTTYRIRVRYYSSSQAGNTKLVITPTQWLIKSGSSSIETSEDIWLVENQTSYNLGTSLALNNTKVFRFVAPSSGTYTFQTTGNYDTYLYVIDPQSSSLLGSVDYDDDSGEGNNALLSKALTAGKTYYVFYSAYNIQNTNSVGNIHVQISCE